MTPFHDTKTNKDNWDECRNLVISELSRLDGNDNEQWNLIKQHTVEIEVIKVKAGLWGFLGASIPILLAIIIYLIKRLAL